MNKSISWLQATNNETMNKYDEMVVRITIFAGNLKILVYFQIIITLNMAFLAKNWKISVSERGGGRFLPPQWKYY